MFFHSLISSQNCHRVEHIGCMQSGMQVYDLVYGHPRLARLLPEDAAGWT